ncbi:MAG: outer membrane channel [Candidatus Omnitrophica bacterium CG_4_10_14_0_2_um_filter_44_9]|nr:MAG: outer membrane channel [Candidatus Omnitrophica bacterium CG_4_10_14_0_8_um_filter_44_12]PIZ84471.1 MAG: outer membrane channel [Candidatus Omnitrophica bacterium CG_4_10_14_0_2_um_filter_44_9]
MASGKDKIECVIKALCLAGNVVQGQYYTRRGNSDFSKVDLYQAYVELSDIDHMPFDLKVGRQEFCYGSAFFIGANDFYEGLVWDGVKARVAPLDNFWIDLIGARYVKLNENKSDPEPALYGIYSSYNLKKDADLDVYFFYHKGGFSFFHADQPDGAKWFTLGARGVGKINEQFDYEIEPSYQFGKIDNTTRADSDTIIAYGGHAEAGYTFKSRSNPRIFAGYAFGSGDNDTSDKKYREFHGNIYNDNYIVGDISIVPDLSGLTVGAARASGMRIGLVGISADISPKLNLNFDYHYFSADKTPSGISRDIGSEINFIAACKLSKDVNIIIGANRFFTADFFMDASGSGKDVNYLYLQTQLNF